jgi:glucose-6-phosphate 1-dehydrogenase
MSTIIAPGIAAGLSSAPPREPAAATSASGPGRAPGSVPRPDNHVIVVFGATGDLARRKLLPGLFHLATTGLMPDRYQIIGVSPRCWTTHHPSSRTHLARGDRGQRSIASPAPYRWHLPATDSLSPSTEPPSSGH